MHQGELFLLLAASPKIYVMTFTLTFNLLLQKNVNEMNKLKHGMVRDEVI